MNIRVIIQPKFTVDNPNHDYKVATIEDNNVEPFEIGHTQIPGSIIVRGHDVTQPIPNELNGNCKIKPDDAKVGRIYIYIYMHITIYLPFAAPNELHFDEMNGKLKKIIRKMTERLNVWENMKHNRNHDAASTLSFEKTISKKYAKLARILRGYSKLQRECLLTVFSLKIPT